MLAANAPHLFVPLVYSCLSSIKQGFSLLWSSLTPRKAKFHLFQHPVHRLRHGFPLWPGLRTGIHVLLALLQCFLQQGADGPSGLGDAAHEDNLARNAARPESCGRVVGNLNKRAGPPVPPEARAWRGRRLRGSGQTESACPRKPHGGPAHRGVQSTLIGCGL